MPWLGYTPSLVPSFFLSFCDDLLISQASIFAVTTVVQYPEMIHNLLHMEDLPHVAICVSLSFGYFVYDMSIVLYYYAKIPQVRTKETDDSNAHTLLVAVYYCPPLFHHHWDSLHLGMDTLLAFLNQGRSSRQEWL